MYCWFIVVAVIVVFYSAVASAFGGFVRHRGPLRLGSQLGAFGRSSQPKPEQKKREALSPVQADTTSPLSPVNIGAASLVGIFAILVVITQTQFEQGKMLQEQGKALSQLDSKFSQVQTDVSTFSSIIATVSTSVIATTFVTQAILGKRTADEGAADKGATDKGRGDARSKR